jgi:UDP-N-acetylmuramoyl-L-alanyl-D-glutamate--2,6-diaminopimelate ligase
VKLSVLADAVRENIDQTEVLIGDDPEISGIEHDSRKVRSGDLFACIPGAHADGHGFAQNAIANGAVALLCERRLAVDVAQIICPNARRGMAHAAAALAGNPSAAISVVGVTGTNGKTTVVTLLGKLLELLGDEVTVLGTLTGARTTPEANELQAALAQAVTDDNQRVVMEVSSHALDMGRVDGIEFEVVAFTNLSVDHLDYHGTIENYFAAKSLLFDQRFAPTAVIDVSSPHGRLLADTSNQDVVRVTSGDVLEANPSLLRLRWRGRDVSVPIGGMFNAANITLVAEIAVVLGFTEEQVAESLAELEPVPGRFEAIVEGQNVAVLVDYAHTPDGLSSVLQAARQVTTDGRVIVVFGCGGDRDHTKRPEMGRIAESLADIVIVTSDNSRSASSLAITEAIVSGMGTPPLAVEIDRRAAIAAALDTAGAGDTLVIAGKGHETTQTTGDSVVAFDDRVVVRELLQELGQSEVAPT